MDPNLRLSILISVFGQADKLKKCLSCVESTLAGKINYEVLIIDDASEDSTQDFLRSLSSEYLVFYNETRSGFAKNNNFLAKKAKGEYLCFLNSDAYVQGDWLFPMLDVFSRKKKVGMVGNVQRLSNSIIYDHFGVVFGPEGNPRHFGQGFLFNPFREKIRQWSAVTAACAMARRETFLSFEGFNEIFLNGCEDVELCIRMSRAGLCHYVALESVIEHVKGASVGRKRYNQKNFDQLMNLWKESILGKESIQDQMLYSITYLYLVIFRPYKVNLSKLVNSFLTVLFLKRLKIPKKKISGTSVESY